jgi:hypothetical protein
VTALCGGGTSAPFPESAAYVRYSSALLAARLALVDTGWLIPIVPLLTLPDLLLSEFCASDPPPVPVFTPAEIDSLIQLQEGPAFDSGLPKVRDWALNAIWTDLCHCTSGTYTPPLPPAQPTGSLVVLTQQANGPAACQTNNWIGQGTNPGGPLQGGFGGIAFPSPGPLVLHIDDTSNIVQPPGFGTTWHLQWTNSVFTVLSETTFRMEVTDRHKTLDFVPPVGSAAYNIRCQSDAGSGEMNHTFVVTFWCNGETPPAAGTPCCLPDTGTQALLDSLMTYVKLLQRQLTPFAYVHGATHTGLTGNGQIAVNGLLGVKLTPGALPPDVGITEGDPDELWLDSWINWGNDDGWTAREFLRTSPQVSMPQLAGQFTRVAYSLRPGLSVDLVELVREA